MASCPSVAARVVVRSASCSRPATALRTRRVSLREPRVICRAEEVDRGLMEEGEEGKVGFHPGPGVGKGDDEEEATGGRSRGRPVEQETGRTLSQCAVLWAMARRDMEENNDMDRSVSSGGEWEQHDRAYDGKARRREDAGGDARRDARPNGPDTWMGYSTYIVL